jgi:hypothetical protein
MQSASIVVKDGVGAVGLCEVNGGLGGRVSGDSEGSVGRKVVVLIEAKRLAVVRGVAATVKRETIVGRREMNAVQK